MICFHCRKPITGRYTTALNHNWHLECFVCTACGTRIDGQFLEHDGNPYHAACYHERFSPRCAGCGQPITGQYTKALGQLWHADHFVCQRCHKPFAGGSYHEHDQHPYCDDCFHDLFSPRCAIGGEPLRTSYLSNDWGDVFCVEHSKECHDCFSCGRPICERLTRGGVSYPDGRTMCTLCRQTAIDAPEQGKATVTQVWRALARLGIDLKGVDVPIHLVSQSELDQRNTKGYTHKPCGMTCSHLFTENGRVVKRTVEEILILRGLPAEHYASIVAHETGHAWLFLNEYPELPPSVEEGICELCNALWLRGQSTDAARRRLKMMDASDDAVYGRGYRAANRSLERLSFQALLAFVRQQRRFP